MSRIERALEKAEELRKSSKKSEREEAHTLPLDSISHEFEIDEPIINIEKVDKHLISITDAGTSIAEQYKKLRVNILKSTEKEFLNTLLITSPEIGEGKTLTAINLAVTMAKEIDYTVLLVDADLKHPAIHKYLGLEVKYGLSDYLMGKVKISDVMIKTGIGKLIFLPAGSPTDNSSELLSSDRMKKLIHEMKYRYNDRYIIFDSAPILVTSDTISLSNLVDGLLIVMQGGRTTLKTAEKALSLINGTNILGVVFNNVPREFAKNLYPYYYGYGKEGYYKKDEKLKE